MSEVIVHDIEERKSRAIILDSKLDDTLLNLFIYSAELVDEKLYKELGYTTARDYFEAKAISVAQAYRYARIGRSIAPGIGSASQETKISLNRIGVKKLEEIVRHASDQIPELLKGDTITLGDEEYSAEDLKETSFKELREQFSKISKKVEKNELLEEQNKTLTLEKKSLEKALEKTAEEANKYKEKSTGFDAIDEDLKEASSCLERARVLINRIDSDEIHDALGIRLHTLIETMQRGGQSAAERHQEVMLTYSDIV